MTTEIAKLDQLKEARKKLDLEISSIIKKIELKDELEYLKELKKNKHSLMYVNLDIWMVNDKVENSGKATDQIRFTSIDDAIHFLELAREVVNDN